jgi:hypothetical protein
MRSVVIRGICLLWVSLITGKYLAYSMWKNACITGILVIILIILFDNSWKAYKNNALQKTRENSDY